MKKLLVVAPHADDETLGCGGSILKFKAQGYQVYWLLVTGMKSEYGYSDTQVNKRAEEIESVTKLYGFENTFQLYLPPAKLETLPLGDIIGPISKVISDVQPDMVFTVYRNDAHSDHEIVYDAVMSATKSFRYPFVKRVMAYETISETDFGTKPEDGGFRANVYIDIEPYLHQKIEIMGVYESELGEFPFPRSIKAIEALSFVRGAQCNAGAAEAFMLIKEII